jgi:hypothetical protein
MVVYSEYIKKAMVELVLINVENIKKTKENLFEEIWVRLF